MERSRKRRRIIGRLWVVAKWCGITVLALLLLTMGLWYRGAPPREDYQGQMIALLDERLGASRRDATKTIHSLSAEAKAVLAKANESAKTAYEQQRALAADGSKNLWSDLIWMDAAFKAETDLEKYRMAAARAAYEQLVKMGFLDQVRTLRQYDCIVSPNIDHLYSFDLRTPSLLIQQIISVSRVRWEDAMARADELEVVESACDQIHFARLFGSQGHLRSVRFVNGVAVHLVDTLVRLEDELADLSPEVLRELLAAFGARPPLPAPSDIAAMSRVEWLYSIDRSVRDNNKTIEMILRRILGQPQRFSRMTKQAFAASESYIEAERRGRPSLNHPFSTTGREEDVEMWDLIYDLRRDLDVAEVVWSGIRVQIALAAYRAQHGAYPETLDALVPEILLTLPQDVFAASGSFGYRRVDPQSDPFGRGFLLWSVGGDGVDNNGTPWTPTEGYGDFYQHFRAFKDRDKGVDYVMNLPISAAIQSSRVKVGVPAGSTE